MTEEADWTGGPGWGGGEGPEGSREIQEGFIAEATFELDLERKGNA